MIVVPFTTPSPSPLAQHEFIHPPKKKTIIHRPNKLNIKYPLSKLTFYIIAYERTTIQ